MNDGRIRTIDTYAWVEEEQGVSYWLAVERSGTGQRKKNRDATVHKPFDATAPAMAGHQEHSPVILKVIIGSTA